MLDSLCHGLSMWWGELNRGHSLGSLLSLTAILIAKELLCGYFLHTCKHAFPFLGTQSATDAARPLGVPKQKLTGVFKANTLFKMDSGIQKWASQGLL